MINGAHIEQCTGPSQSDRVDKWRGSPLAI